MKQIYLALTFCLGAFGWANAQQETTLSTMRSLPQATYTNPAFVPLQPFYLGLPGISSVGAYGSSNSLSYNRAIDFETLGEEFSSARLLSLSSKLEDKNWLAAGAQLDLLSMGLRVNPRLHLRYRMSTKLNMQAMVPRDIAMLASEEFLQKANVVSLDPSINGQAYLEHALGASYSIKEKLIIGANIKRLNGIAAIQTKQASYRIESNPQASRLRMEGEMLVHMTPSTDAFDAFELDYNSVNAKVSTNGGWAIDLGSTYQLTPKLQLGLSITDLGSIKWTADAREFRTNKTSFTFDGLSGETPEEEQERFEGMMEDIADQFEPVEKSIASFSTGLPTRMYLNATYQLHRSVHASGIFFGESYAGRFLPGFTTAIHKDFGRILEASISYTAINNSYANIGAGLSVRLGPFQLYAVTDNVLAAFAWQDAKAVNARAGMNLVFGTIRKPTKLPY